MKAATIVVTGATGKQGGAVARALRQKAWRVRALVRDPKSRAAKSLAGYGVEVVKGDFDEPSSMREAFRGADVLYAMSTPYDAGIEAETQRGLRLLDAAQQVHVPRVVLSTVANVRSNTGIPHFDSKIPLEEKLIDSRIDHVILGPTSFMENWLGPWLRPGLEKGHAAMPVPVECKVQHVAIDNLAAFATLVVERFERFNGSRVDLASDSISTQDVARVLSETLGRPFEPVQVPIEAIREQSEDFARLFEWFRDAGYTVDIRKLRADYPEVEWLDFRQWASKQDWSVLG